MAAINSKAFWISPVGKILPVRNKHITDILRDPEKFGVENNYVRHKYREHGERTGWEGKARREIMRTVINRGWTRARYFHSKSTGEYWSVETKSDKRRFMGNIWHWSVNLYQGKYGRNREHERMKIRFLNGSELVETTIAAMMEDSFLETYLPFTFNADERVTLFDITEHRLRGDRIRCSEASLQRIYYQLIKQGDGDESFALISAFNADNEHSDNLQLNKDLIHDIKSQQLAYSTLKGYWTECRRSDINFDECPQDQLTDVAEPYLFVYNISLNVARKFGEKYNQDAILYSGADLDSDAPREVHIVHLEAGETETESVGTFHPFRISRAISSFKGKSSVFKGFDYRPLGLQQMLVERKLREDLGLEPGEMNMIFQID